MVGADGAPTTGFEFDAINARRDAMAELEAERAKDETAANDLRTERLHAAIAEFLRRMTLAGNPGATVMFKTGLFTKVKGWSIGYSDAEHFRRLPLSIDGRTDIRRPGSLEPYEEWRPQLSQRQFESFMEHLASMLRANGLS
jgi:hypothetical protein